MEDFSKMNLPFGTQSPDFDVLIVGAGLSGLTSAVKILSKEQSLNIIILDENSVPGGLLSVDGSRFVNTEQQRLITFLNLFHVAPHQRLSNISRLKRCWDLDRGLTSVPAKIELTRYIDMLDLRMKKFQSARYKLRKRASTMEHHICGSLFFNKSRRFMLNVVELVCGVDASEVNYDEFMCVCSSCGGLRMIIDLYINFPGNMFEISSKKLVSAILEKLKNIGIYTNRKVTDVEHFKNYVLVTDSSGNRYTAEAVIMAIPWNNVEQINFMPAMPERFRAEPRVAVKSKRVITQFSVSYSKSFWDLLGYSGHFLCSSPFIVGHENRPATFSGYMLHAPAQDGDVRRVVLQQLAKHFGKEMLEPIDYNENSFGLSVTLHKPQIRPWNRIIWSSSSAVGTYYRNLMGGAVDSGLRAAVNALFVVRPQVVGWKDLLDMQEKDLYKSETPSRVKGLLSRLNLYNVTFYSVFVLGLIFLLNLGYQRSS